MSTTMRPLTEEEQYKVKQVFSKYTPDELNLTLIQMRKIERLLCLNPPALIYKMIRSRQEKMRQQRQEDAELGFKPPIIDAEDLKFISMMEAKKGMSEVKPGILCSPKKKKKKSKRQKQKISFKDESPYVHQCIHTDCAEGEKPEQLQKIEPPKHPKQSKQTKKQQKQTAPLEHPEQPKRVKSPKQHKQPKQPEQLVQSVRKIAKKPRGKMLRVIEEFCIKHEQKLKTEPKPGLKPCPEPEPESETECRPGPEPDCEIVSEFEEDPDTKYCLDCGKHVEQYNKGQCPEYDEVEPQSETENMTDLVYVPDYNEEPQSEYEEEPPGIVESVEEISECDEEEQQHVYTPHCSNGLVNDYETDQELVYHDECCDVEDEEQNESEEIYVPECDEEPQSEYETDNEHAAYQLECGEPKLEYGDGVIYQTDCDDTEYEYQFANEQHVC